MRAHFRPRSLLEFYEQDVRPRLSLDVVFDGVEFRPGRGGERRARCPLHNGTDPNFTVNLETLEWFCHSQCQVGGDAIAYIQKSRGIGFKAAVMHLAAAVGATADWRQGWRPRTVSARRVAQRPPKAPSRPALDEVLALWEAARPVSDDPEARQWLVGRALSPATIDARQLARVLPVGGALPSWAAFGKAAWNVGERFYRLLVPLFDHTGALRSVRARALSPRLRAKAVPPQGYSPSGLVMANAASLALFGRRASAAEVWICEGEPDFWTLATHWSDDADRAVVGLFSGAWASEFSAGVPDGATVVLATDADAAGDAYAASVTATFVQRCRSGSLKLVRWHAPSTSQPTSEGNPDAEDT